MRFKGKVVIVTGASTGLGPIMAGLFAADCGSVVLAARRIDLVRDAAAAIGEAAIAVQTNVTQERERGRDGGCRPATIRCTATGCGASQPSRICLTRTRARTTAGSALRTSSKVEDIARVALFLASDDARTITGQSLTVDAGINMARFHLPRVTCYNHIAK
jgi:NAD(P)-dependent dehydrogenase (short-subunit alcohol dehydrogenase family)